MSTVFRRAEAPPTKVSRKHWLLTLLGGIALIGASLIAGLIATTASPLLVGLVVGIIIAALLLNTPNWAVTAFIFLALTMGVALSLLGQGFSRLSWGVSLLGFFLLLPALLHLPNLKKAPAFIYLTVAFMLYCICTSVLQLHSMVETIVGVKRYYLPFGLILVLTLVPFTDSDLRLWRKLLTFVAALQLPFAIYEFLVLVPLRGGLQAGSTVTDVVAGTMGANLTGGSPNSVMAVFLLIGLAFLISWWKEGLISFRLIFYGVIFSMVPIGLGEIKVAFLMFPLMFLILYQKELIKRPFQFIGLAALGGGLLFLMAYILLEWIMRSSLGDVIDGTIAYNFQNRGYGNFYLNRTTVLTFWWDQQGWHDPIGLFLGHGLGSAHFDENALVVGSIAKLWPNHGIGLTTASQLLWDVGIVGFCIYLLVFWTAWQATVQLKRDSINPVISADAAALQVAITLFAVTIFYNDSLVTLPSMQVLLGLTLGYIALLCRQSR